MKEITVEELVQSKELIPVDVRAPIEHGEAAIPGSINIPLFTNEEREEIGILYKKEGSEAAKWRAMELVTPKLPRILNQIKDLKNAGVEPVIHCWRGGSRSKAVATFLEMAGIPAIRLEGGYRAYREYILEKTPALLPERAVVLHGFTGTGKTEILHHLHKRGYPVLDLEKLANHRGSLFGSIGIGDSYNQKTFDALLFERLNEIKGSPYFIMEAESKRIGRATQPELMLKRKTDGFHFLIDCSFENRVERIFNEYVQPFQTEEWFQQEILEKVKRIEKRLRKPDIIEAIEEATFAQNYREVISILFKHYYDPRYSYSLKEYPGDFMMIDGNDSLTAAEEIERQLEIKLNQIQKLNA